MLQKAGASVIGALKLAGVAIVGFVIVGFMYAWATNPDNKSQRDETGNSVVEAGFTVTDAVADWVTRTAEKHTSDTPAARP